MDAIGNRTMSLKPGVVALQDSTVSSQTHNEVAAAARERLASATPNGPRQANGSADSGDEDGDDEGEGFTSDSDASLAGSPLGSAKVGMVHSFSIVIQTDLESSI